MHRLLERVEKELNTVADKGLTSSNLDSTYKLIDIYKDIKESEYYESKLKDDSSSYDMPRSRDSRGRYNDSDRYNRRGDWDSDRYGMYYPGDERTERYIERIRDGMGRYNAGRSRYRDGDSSDRMVDGIEMTMSAICMFVESLMDYAETSQEKEVIRKHINKLKNM